MLADSEHYCNHNMTWEESIQILNIMDFQKQWPRYWNQYTQNWAVHLLPVVGWTENGLPFSVTTLLHEKTAALLRWFLIVTKLLYSDFASIVEMG